MVEMRLLLDYFRDNRKLKPLEATSVCLNFLGWLEVSISTIQEVIEKWEQFRARKHGVV